MIRSDNSQSFLVHCIVNKFREIKGQCFEDFEQCWRVFGGSMIHSKFLHRGNIFGKCQAAYQSFLGYSDVNLSEYDRKSCIYGLYLTYYTQCTSKPDPILITVDEMENLLTVSKITIETENILRHLVKNECFCFSVLSYRIKPPKYGVPLLFSDDTIPAFALIDMKRKNREKLDRDRCELSDLDSDVGARELIEGYNELLGKIFEEEDIV